MRISHKHKFVFISKNKCASSSIRRLLDPYSDIVSSQRYPYYHHTPASKLKMHFESMGWDWGGYFTFTTLRNPFTMLKSLYNFGLPDTDGLYYWDRHWDDISNDIYKPERFDVPPNLISFCEWIMTYDLSKFTLDYFVKGDDGSILMDYILPIENMSVGLAHISHKLRLPLMEVHIVNNKLYQFTEFKFSKDMARRIVDVFSSDMEAGNYSIPALSN
jgi:hypothetical protein